MKTLGILAGLAVVFLFAASASACGVCGCGKEDSGSNTKAAPTDEATSSTVNSSMQTRQGSEAGETSEATGEEVRPQTRCPVKGLPINRKRYVDYEGKRVYFCCPGCDKKSLENPDKYLEKIQEQGVTLEKVQVDCPVMGRKISRKLFVDHDGKRIYLCCKGCVKAVQDDPEKYIEKLEADGVTLEKALVEEDKGM